MEKLGLSIQPFILHRRLLVIVDSHDEERHSITLGGVDTDGTPVTFIRSVRMEGNRRTVKTEPFTITHRDSLSVGTILNLEIEFMGHYNGPNLTINHVYSGRDARDSL